MTFEGVPAPCSEIGGQKSTFPLTSDNAPTFSPAKSEKVARYGRRKSVQKVTRLKRAKDCGYQSIVSGGSVVLRGTVCPNGHRVAGFAGLASCGSVWACPVCNWKIMAERRRETLEAIEAARSKGLRLVFVTLTLRHSKADRLETLWDTITYAWYRVTKTKVWRELVKAGDIAGYIRVPEVNVGPNGWHIHIHTVLLLSADADASKISEGMIKRWTAGAKAKGLRSPLRIGQDWREVGSDEEATAIGEYLTKFTDGVENDLKMAHELTSSQSKTEGKTLPVWSLIDGIEDGEEDSIRMWWEYEKVSKGRKFYNRSHGLRELLGLQASRDDEEIAAEEVGTKTDAVVWLPSSTWVALRDAPAEVVGLLDEWERNDLVGVEAWLTARNLEYQRAISPNDLLH